MGEPSVGVPETTRPELKYSFVKVPSFLGALGEPVPVDDSKKISHIEINLTVPWNLAPNKEVSAEVPKTTALLSEFKESSTEPFQSQVELSDEFFNPKLHVESKKTFLEPSEPCIEASTDGTLEEKIKKK